MSARVLQLAVVLWAAASATAKVYERCELAAELLGEHGVPREQVATWVCIAFHESSFNTAAVGRLNGDGSADHGLLQISDRYWCGVDGPGRACDLPCAALEDEDLNDDITCALKIYEEHTGISGDGFNAWTVYPRCKGHKSKKFIEGCQHFDDTQSNLNSTKKKSIPTRGPRRLKSISGPSLSEEEINRIFSVISLFNEASDIEITTKKEAPKIDLDKLTLDSELLNRWPFLATSAPLTEPPQPTTQEQTTQKYFMILDTTISSAPHRYYVKNTKPWMNRHYVNIDRQRNLNTQVLVPTLQETTSPTTEIQSNQPTRSSRRKNLKFTLRHTPTTSFKPNSVENRIPLNRRRPTLSSNRGSRRTRMPRSSTADISDLNTIEPSNLTRNNRNRATIQPTSMKINITDVSDLKAIEPSKLPIRNRKRAMTKTTITESTTVRSAKTYLSPRRNQHRTQPTKPTKMSTEVIQTESTASSKPPTGRRSRKLTNGGRKSTPTITTSSPSSRKRRRKEH